MTDPAKALAAALCRHARSQRDPDAHDAEFIDEARALIAQIKPALVAEAVAQERARFRQLEDCFMQAAAIRARKP